VIKGDGKKKYNSEIKTKQKYITKKKKAKELG
jgi:hypothetical protein